MPPTRAVVPLDDLYPHDDYSPDCACNPKTEILEGDQLLIIHNAFDGREIFEQLDEEAKP